MQHNATQAAPLLDMSLAGVPAAVVHISKATWAVADSMAGLYLVDLRSEQECSMHKITADVPLTVAHGLFSLPTGQHFLVCMLLLCIHPCITWWVDTSVTYPQWRTCS